MSDESASPRQRAGTLRIFAIVVGIATLVAGAEFYALWQSRHPQRPAVVTVQPESPTAIPAQGSARSQLETIGGVDTPAAEAVVGPSIHISGWAYDPTGIRAIEIRVDGLRFPAATGIARADVAQSKPELANAAQSGFDFTGDFSSHPPPAGIDRRVLSVVAIANDGRETVLATKSLINPAVLDRWRWLAQADPATFHLIPATSGIKLGGALELDSTYTPYVSSTVRVGVRVPILYLRTTRGEAADFVFDPDWDIERRCGTRRIADDSLRSTLDHALARNLPVLLTLNGGIWADAACDVPDWDINDKLEQTAANCQWNEKNQVMPDDARKDLPGSQEAPQLGRSLTFNVYARDVRHYKKRNLQQVAAIIVGFMAAHPSLVVGVTLDPDAYLNPFFGEEQWYDYNPGTLKQFRQWLSVTGPYAGKPEPGVPDLSAYRRQKPLSLADVNRLSGRRFASWSDVDPPRTFTRDASHPFWNDPWVREWEVFRRHLVHLHYDELAKWLVEAGMPRDRIWSSQGLMAPRGEAMPFALTIASPVKNYDSGGMSVEGAKPKNGHLGVILYGPSAENDIRMENGKPLFATLASIDPKFAVVELNTADLLHPDALPTYGDAYRSLRELWNAGARFVSPMAWNGSNGIFAGKPGYVTFTAWRNTPLEDASRDFMLARAGLPLGSVLWTFGTSRYADADGWTTETGSVTSAPGALMATSDASARLALVSPRGLSLTLDRIARIVAGVPSDVKIATLTVAARGAGDAPWERIIEAKGDAIARTAAGRVATRTRNPRIASIDQLRIEMTFDAPVSAMPLTRIALLGTR